MNRVYNGCPDDELREKLEELVRMENKMIKLHPDYHVTYFPVEEKYQVTEWGKAISKMHTSKISAILEVLEK